MNILLLSSGGGGGNILRSVKALFRRDLVVTQRRMCAFTRGQSSHFLRWGAAPPETFSHGRDGNESTPRRTSAQTIAAMPSNVNTVAACRSGKIDRGVISRASGGG